MTEPSEENPQPVSIPAHKPEIDIVMPRLPTLAARAFVYILIITIVAVSAWSIMSRVDVVVECRGVVIPEGEPVYVEASVPGLVAEVAVDVGQKVAKGDLLFRIDTLELSGRADRSRREFEGLTLEFNKLMRTQELLTEILERGPSPELISAIPMQDAAREAAELARAVQDLKEAKLLAGDTSLAGGVSPTEARLRRLAKQSEIDQARSALAEAIEEKSRTELALQSTQVGYEQSVENLKAARSTREGAEMMLSLLHKEEQTYKSLSDSGMISEIEYLGRLREYERQKYELARMQAAEEQARQEVDRQKLGVESAKRDITRIGSLVDRSYEEINRKGIELSLIGEEGQRRVTAALENYLTVVALVRHSLERVEDAEGELEPRMRAQQSVIHESEEIEGRGEIRAPIDGMIAHVEIKNPGQQVEPGKPVIHILPSSAQLIGELRVSNKDIAKIRERSTCRFKLDAYPFNDFGALTGKIHLVNPDAFPGSSDYRVLVRFDRPYYETRDGKRAIQAGMQMDAEIKVKDRRIIEYVFEPFFKLAKGGIVVTE